LGAPVSVAAAPSLGPLASPVGVPASNVPGVHCVSGGWQERVHAPIEQT
jgi:hypothetical protein